MAICGIIAAITIYVHFKTLNGELDRQGAEAAKGYSDYNKALQEATTNAEKETADFNDWLKKLDEKTASATNNP